MNKKVEIRNNSYKFIKWDELKAYDCNSLKEASGRDISKLKNAIVNSKFSFPFYVWKRYIVDGAGRTMALKELEAEGYSIPELPIIEIEAANEREAKKLVLEASSQHGTVTQESFDLFVDDLDLTASEFEGINFDFSDSMNNYNNLDTDDQDLLDPEAEKKASNDYVVVLQLPPDLMMALDGVKKKDEFILNLLKKELL